MAVHTIMIPVNFRDEMQDVRKSVIWDDEAGTVEGDHFGVAFIRDVLDGDRPAFVGHTGYHWLLDDPGHDPAQFLVLVQQVHWPMLEKPLRATLPPVFDGVNLLPATPGELAPGTPVYVDAA